MRSFSARDNGVACVGPGAAPMDGSRVTEIGSHDELMARGGTYADLYRIQASSYA